MDLPAVSLIFEELPLWSHAPIFLLCAAHAQPVQKATHMGHFSFIISHVTDFDGTRVEIEQTNFAHSHFVISDCFSPPLIFFIKQAVICYSRNLFSAKC